MSVHVSVSVCLCLCVCVSVCLCVSVPMYQCVSVGTHQVGFGRHAGHHPRVRVEGDAGAQGHALPIVGEGVAVGVAEVVGQARDEWGDEGRGGEGSRVG